jgi:predicted flap endonuclease-1-like 5' DNA nuclease
MPAEDMSRFAALERALAARERKIRELENELSLAHGWGAAVSDDLTRIKGIGPKLCQRLKDSGVSSFAAIAAWSPEDVENYAAALKVPATRILRDDWMQSAKALLQP